VHHSDDLDAWSGAENQRTRERLAPAFPDAGLDLSIDVRVELHPMHSLFEVIQEPLGKALSFVPV
jgi:hypothetical protein